MKHLSNLLMGVGSNLFVVLLVMMLLPAFLVTDHVELMDQVHSYLFKS
jgi:hypothetical protein